MPTGDASPLRRIADERDRLYADPRGPAGTLSRRQEARNAELVAEYEAWTATLPDPAPSPTPAPSRTAPSTPDAAPSRRWASPSAFDGAVDEAAAALDDPAVAAGAVRKALGELDALDRLPRIPTVAELLAVDRPPNPAGTPVPDGSSWRRP